jgi:hypothetical protein
MLQQARSLGPVPTAPLTVKASASAKMRVKEVMVGLRPPPPPLRRARVLLLLLHTPPPPPPTRARLLSSAKTPAGVVQSATTYVTMAVQVLNMMPVLTERIVRTVGLAQSVPPPPPPPPLFHHHLGAQTTVLGRI